MPLRCRPFTRQDIAALAGGDFGSDEWALEVNSWLLDVDADSAAKHLDDGFPAWVYEEDSVAVGFGTLASAAWASSGFNPPWWTIPMVALLRDFHGRKTVDGTKYSDAVIIDLIAKARSAGAASLGLVVHVGNEPAIRVYERHGFEFIIRAADPQHGTNYHRMAMRLV